MMALLLLLYACRLPMRRHILQVYGVQVEHWVQLETVSIRLEAGS
jgi:hypothetical protein